MRALGLLGCTLALAIVASTVVMPAQADSAACNGPGPSFVVAINVDHGFRNYLLGIGKPYWRRAISPLAQGPYCGTASQVATAKGAYAVQKRFYALLMAFPQRPTRAQWNARFKPLVDAAIACDKVIIEIDGHQDVQVHDLAWLRSIRNSPYGTNLQ